MKSRINALLARLRHLYGEAIEGRAFCDTAPVMERYWACQAGIGWKGKNQQLIIPKAGSAFFLGELFLNVETEYDAPIENRCGTCRKCIEACPTGALSEENGLDARRCLSYLTIENRGEIPAEWSEKMGTTLYGCDRCQQACPHHRYAEPTEVDEFSPSAQFLAMKPTDWAQLTVEQYRQLFKGSAVKRAKYEGLVRNIRCVLENVTHSSEE